MKAEKRPALPPCGSISLTKCTWSKKCLYWILGNDKRVNFWHDICMKESSLRQNPQEIRSHITETITVSYFIESD